jgi:uncharacterized protein YjiS (DUF1127 family)
MVAASANRRLTKEHPMQNPSLSKSARLRSADKQRGAAIAFLLVLSGWLGRCAERARQRRALATLPDHALKDIGLTRDDVEAEIGKPWWRP